MRRRPARERAALAAGGLLLAWVAPHAAAGAQSVVLATLTGSSVEVSGAATELDAAGHLRISGGASLDLHGSAADLDLVRGGAIHLCGPAQMSIAAGGENALLLSLGAGGLYLRYASPASDSLLTPDFRLSTVVPPDQLATVSAAVDVAPDGALCVTNRGSALRLDRLAGGGTPEYIINGDSKIFLPAGGERSLPACACAPQAPAAVADANRANGAAGALFPAQPALTIDGAVPSPAGGSAAAAHAPASSARPRRNVFARFWRWMLGKRG